MIKLQLLTLKTTQSLGIIAIQRVPYRDFKSVGLF